VDPRSIDAPDELRDEPVSDDDAVDSVVEIEPID
jgi:hypothetical protein